MSFVIQFEPKAIFDFKSFMTTQTPMHLILIMKKKFRFKKLLLGFSHECFFPSLPTCKFVHGRAFVEVIVTKVPS